MYVAAEILALQRKMEKTCSINSQCMHRAKAIFSGHRKVTSQFRMETVSSPTTLHQLPLCIFSLQLMPSTESSKGIST